VKYVLRYRCVCKSWLSLISHPNFATLHFHLAASPTHNLLSIGNDCFPETLSIDFDASLNGDSAYVPPILDFMDHQQHPQIGGSCRGFVFLHSYKGFYLWNPSTGVHKQIPRSPMTIGIKLNILNRNILRFLYGFAYEPSTDDYLVVLWSYKCYNDYDRLYNLIDLEIFSLRANKWKHLEVGFHLPYMVINTNRPSNKVGLFLNGAIHWVVHNHETNIVVIIALALKETTISEIALPNDFCVTYSIQYDLLVLDGLISAWTVDMDTVEIWVMQEYAVHSSWIKTLVFSIRPDPDFFLVYFTNCGDIVGTDGHDELVKFNYTKASC